MGCVACWFWSVSLAGVEVGGVRLLLGVVMFMCFVMYMCCVVVAVVVVLCLLLCVDLG